MTMLRTRKMAFIIVAVIALAVVPCAWDAPTIADASWLPALLATLR